MSENTVKNTQVTQPQIPTQQENAEDIYELCLDPRKFERHSEAQITSTSDLTKLINESFSILTDYSGCRVYIFNGSNPDIPPEIRQTMAPGCLYADLYFNKNDHTGGKYESLVPANSKDGNSDLANKLARIGAITNNSQVQNPYVLNKETKDMLTPYLSGYFGVRKQFNPMWNSRLISEITQVNPWMSQNQRVVLRCIGADVDALMGLVYGVNDNPKDPNAQVRYDYHCMPVATSMKNRMMYGYAPTMGYGNEYVIQILRNDRKIIGAMRDAIGMDMRPVGSTYTPVNQ